MNKKPRTNQVLAIGHLISPLVFIEVKVIQFLVFSVVQNCICYVFYSVCLEFCCFDDLVLPEQISAGSFNYLLNLGRVTSEGSRNNVSINRNWLLPVSSLKVVGALDNYIPWLQIKSKAMVWFRSVYYYR
jgi:hypothetical protein